MNTVRVDKKKLVKLLMDLTHVSGPTADMQISVDVENGGDASFWPGGPQYVGWVVVSPWEFVDEAEEDFTWGDVSVIRDDYGLDDDEPITDEMLEDEEELAEDYIYGMMFNDTLWFVVGCDEYGQETGVALSVEYV